MKTIFRGRELLFKSKSSKVFDMKDEEKSMEYAHWLAIYGGLVRDITSLFPEGGDENGG